LRLEIIFISKYNLLSLIIATSDDIFSAKRDTSLYYNWGFRDTSAICRSDTGLIMAIGWKIEGLPRGKHDIVASFLTHIS